MVFPARSTRYICRACRVRIARQNCRYSTNTHQAKVKLPDGPVRTRFAPSPTGYLHFGSVRTALFNYLLARRTHGQFLLRIEDTDHKRTVSDAESRILQDLKWLGLQWDEGPEIGGPHAPYKQSERAKVYKEHAHHLLETNQAYRCFCSAEALHAKGQRRSSDGLTTLYDRTCYHISSEESAARAMNGEAFVVRLRTGASPISYFDFVSNSTYELSPTSAKRAAAQGVYDDFVLMKTDGLPTYHFANVVDDHLMRITHVIRGVEWQISTPKHLSLYQAFGWRPPAFGHIGLLLNADGTKMSKRDKTFDLQAYKARGVLPEALVNFLALHGWSHTEKSDFMTLKDLENTFDLAMSNTNPTVSLPKLWFLAPKHAMQRVAAGGKDLDDLTDLVCDAIPDTMKQNFPAQPLLDAGHEPSRHRNYVERILRADAKNYINAPDFVASHAYFFLKTPKAIEGTLPSRDKVDRVRQCFTDALARKYVHATGGWNHEELLALTSSAIEALMQDENEHKLKKKEVWQILRCVLTGGEKGPSLVETMEILGLDVVLERLRGFNLEASGQPKRSE